VSIVDRAGHVNYSWFLPWLRRAAACVGIPDSRRDDAVAKIVLEMLEQAASGVAVQWPLGLARQNCLGQRKAWLRTLRERPDEMHLL
jgi:hypothetical protein